MRTGFLLVCVSPRTEFVVPHHFIWYEQNNASWIGPLANDFIKGDSIMGKYRLGIYAFYERAKYEFIKK